MTIMLFFKILPWALFILSLGISAFIIWLKNIKIKFLKNENAKIIVSDSKKQKEISNKIREKTIKYERDIINAKDKVDSSVIINNMANDVMSFFDKNHNS